MIDIYIEYFVQMFAGNYIIASMFLFVPMICIALLIRATRPFLVGLSLLILYGLTEASFLPSWSFLLILIITGIFIAKSLSKAIFNPQ